jgi:DNA-binding NarL/FixJ family response regulator
MAYLEGRGRYGNRAFWPLPRLLVLDQWMPRVSGVEVLSWLRGNTRFERLPVLVLTGGPPPDQIELTQRFKAAYCVKSVESKVMLEALRTSIASALSLVWHASPICNASPFSPETPSSIRLSQRTECSHRGESHGCSTIGQLREAIDSPPTAGIS